MFDKAAIIEARWQRVLEIGIKQISRAWNSNRPSGFHLLSVGTAIGDHFNWMLTDIVDWALNLGFSGIEVRASSRTKFDLSCNIPNVIIGVHLNDKASWTKLWYDNILAVRERFGSSETAYKYLEARTKEELIERKKEEIAFGNKLNAQYFVLHGSEIDFDQIIERYRGSNDHQVRNAVLELIRELDDQRILVENAPVHEEGFHFTRDFKMLTTSTTADFLLDTSHFQMSLGSPEVFEEQIKKIALSRRVKAIHLSESFPRLRPTASLPANSDFWEKRQIAQSVIVDDHLPVGENIKKPRTIIETIRPKFVIHELKSDDFQELSRAIAIQQAALCGFEI